MFSILVSLAFAPFGRCLAEVDKAKEVFDGVRRADPFRLDGLDALSNVLFVQGDEAELARLAQRAVEVDRYRLETCCIVGNLHR